MDQKDREEVEAMINHVVITKQEIKEDIIEPFLVSHKSDLKIINAYHEGDLKLINYDLKKILKETAKHTKRMKKIEQAALVQDQKIIEIEKRGIKSDLSFPQEERIRKLEDESLTASSIKKWINRSVFITAVVITALITLIQFLIEKL